MQLSLLVPSVDRCGSALTLFGRDWSVVEYELGADPERPRPYTAISYSCGQERVPHPIEGRTPMPARTLPALEAAMRVQSTDAIWVDAFCWDADVGGGRVDRLEMDAIYSQATEVVVVLSPSCADVLDQIASSSPVDEPALLRFEEDDWVSRMWTYHEVVNSNRVYFVAIGGDAAVEAEDLFRELAYAIHEYTSAHGLSGFQFAEVHPHLSRMEDLLLDWKMWAHLQRSAYQTLASTHGRAVSRAEDYYRSLFGAIADSRQLESLHAAESPAEEFLRMCESAGDFSFVYTTARRDGTRRWRPIPGERLEVVLPWPTYGQGQSGTLDGTSLRLEQMWLPLSGGIDDETRDFLVGWLGGSADRIPACELPEAVALHLQPAGLDSDGGWLELEQGYFFPHPAFRVPTDVIVAVASGIRTTFGGVALALTKSADAFEFRGVGVFVGRMRSTGQSIVVT